MAREPSNQTDDDAEDRLADGQHANPVAAHLAHVALGLDHIEAIIPGLRRELEAARGLLGGHAL